MVKNEGRNEVRLGEPDKEILLYLVRCGLGIIFLKIRTAKVAPLEYDYVAKWRAIMAQQIDTHAGQVKAISVGLHARRCFELRL
jgi:hypothetical protein